MRYRRLSYRYAVVMATSKPRPFTESWQHQTTSVSLAQTSWRPATDIVETAGEVIVLVELAGVNHEELDVLLFEDALIVEGERRLPATDGNGVYHAAEIRQGQLRLELPLPCPIDPDQVDARYERGLLEMRLGKKRSAGSRSVSIPAGQTVDAAAVTNGPNDTSTSAAGRADTPREREDDGA
jgi:HSP20 family protein